MSINNFASIQVRLASPETILKWSHGEVTKPETINYRSQKAERDGLFCERIFGPTKDWECACGKYKKVRFKGVVCDRCGVEITKASVRRERMGHIHLAAPVAHIWYLRGIPSRMALLLDVTPKQLEEVVYFVSYIVTDPKESGLAYKQILSEREFRENQAIYGSTGFTAQTGAEAVLRLLQDVDLESEYQEVQDGLEKAQGEKRKKLIKRLDTINAFRNSENLPEWMILTNIPVIPPDLRPMLQLDGGRFATSDLNDLYRRVITRNNRLRKLLDLGTPNIIVQNEKRMLQESVDALIDNGRRSKPITGAGGRALKFYSSVRLDVRRIEALKQGGEVVGNRTRVKIVKNKVAPPFREAEFDIMFGQGISREGDVLDLAVNAGIVNKSGAWYAYEGDKIGQGRENAKTYIHENPAFFDMLEAKVRDFYFTQPEDEDAAVQEDSEKSEADEQ